MFYFKSTFAPALIGLMLVASCNTAEPEQRDLITLTESSLSQTEAMSQFASILSQAAADNENLRTFIRKQALDMFDNDYDVFYPFVKDMTVSGSKTFAQILSEYCSDDAQLQAIEAAVPKLTILVPDWEWLDAFSVNKWDTSDPEVLVGYAESGETRTLYKDGEANTLEEGEFPLSPTLIIKSNERMVASGVTKSGERTFAFRHHEFDKRNTPKRLETRGRDWHSDDISLPVTEFVGDFVPASDIDPLVIRAYNEFKDGSVANACQRDYIYYGMSKSNRDSGVLNTGIRERLYRFRIAPNAYERIADAQGEDAMLSDEITKHGRSNQLSVEQLLERIWSDGGFEIHFDFYVVSHDGDNNKIVPRTSVSYSCNPSDLFELKSVHREFKKQTAVARGVYKYSFKKDNLATKWFYPTDIQTLPSVWDISSESSDIMIHATEEDDSTEVISNKAWTYHMSQNFGLKFGKKVKIDFGTNKDSGHNGSLLITKTETSDEFGYMPLEYEQRIIEKPSKKNINGVEVDGYDIRNVALGDLVVTLLPVNIR